MKIKEWLKANWLQVIIVILLLFVAAQYFSGAVPFAAQSIGYAGGMEKAMYAPTAAVEMDMMARSEYMPYPSDDGWAEIPEEASRKVIKNGNAQLEVPRHSAVQKANDVEAFVSDKGGYTLNRNEYKSSVNNVEYLDINMQVKVPFEHFDATMTYLRGLGEAKSFSVSASDVTQQYYDVKAYLDSYEAEKAHIQTLLEKSTNVEELIKVEERLADIQRRIDDHRRQLANLERQTDFSQVYINLEEKREISQIGRYFTPFTQLVETFARSLNGLIVFFAKAIAWIIPLGIIYLIYRAVKRRKKKK